MMVIGAVERLHMQGHPGIHREGLKPFLHQFGIESAHFVAGETRPETSRNGRPGNIQSHAGQRLVHRQMHGGIAGDALHLAERLLHGLAERNATSSVVWWWSICRSPLALTVISIREWRANRSSIWSRKPIPGRDVRDAGAIEIDGDRDFGFLVARFTAALRMRAPDVPAFYQAPVRGATPA